MKKILIVTLALLISSGVFAQKFRFGFKGTTGYSGFTNLTNVLKNDAGKWANGYGIMLDWNLGDHYAVATGVDMTYKGGSLQGTIDTLNLKSKINLQYLQIPFGLKMKTGEIGYMTYFLNAGTSLGIRLNSKGDYNIGAYAIADSSLNDYVNPLALSLLISAGVEYNLTGSTSLMVSLMFDNSFLDFLKDDIKTNSTGGKIVKDISGRVNVYGINVGIFF